MVLVFRALLTLFRLPVPQGSDVHIRNTINFRELVLSMVGTLVKVLNPSVRPVTTALLRCVSTEVESAPGSCRAHVSRLRQCIPFLMRALPHPTVR